MPDLRWADLEVMPRLRAFAVLAAAGELSVATTAPVTRCADAAVTFSAGTRAGAGDDCAMSAAALADARRRALHNRFAARVGALGTALHAAGLRTAAVGAAAVPLLADERGAVDVTDQDFGAAVTAADVVAVVDDGLYRATQPDRLTEAAHLDTVLADQLSATPRDATVVVAGVSDGAATTSAHLHALLVAGPTWAHRELRSGSTGRAPFVQLIDLAPTVLHVLHLPVPPVMAGRPARLTPRHVSSYAVYAHDDEHAVLARSLGRDSMRGIAIGVIAVLVLLVAGWRRRWPTMPARIGAALLVGVPAATFLAQLAPWWRWGVGAYAGILAAGAVVGAAAVAVAARRGPARAVLVGAGLTAAVLVADQLAGSPLQLSAPLGDSPLVAGRFHGMGNIAFGLASAALLLSAGVIAGPLAAAGRRRAAATVVAAVAVAAVVVDAAPMLGDDFGGLLALVPAFGLLFALVAGIRVSRRRVAGFVAVALLVAVAVAAADYARPAADQTHIGRFAGQVLHGGALRVVRRKADASLGSVGNSITTWLVAVVIVASGLARRRLPSLLARVEGLPAAVVSAAVLAVLGSALNDSGISVAAAVAVVVVPVLAASGVLDRDRPAGAPRVHGDPGDDHDDEGGAAG